MPTTPQETRTRFDDDNDGRIDRIAFDDDGDGNIDRSEAYSYNSNGNRIRTRFDDDNDGRIDRVAFDVDGDGNIDRTAHLNAAGRWERVEQDVDDDGNIDRIDHYAFAADGTRSLTRSESYSYDASGNRTRTAFDDDADGTADRSEAYSYNSNGNRIRTRFDDDNDGRIDRVAFDLDGDGNIDRTAHLNAAGRWERVEQDVDDDGNIDRIDHYAFAADGARSLTRSGFDNDGDGNIDRSEAYSYNSNGNRIRTRFDDDNDGRIDRIAFDVDGDGNINRTAHLNAAGRWERVEQDVDDDGNIDRIDHYAFAADGTRSLTRSESYSYDASGNRTRTAFDTDADGTADRSEAYSYNSNGNRIRTRFDDDNDGRIDRIAFDVDGDGNIDRTAHLNAAGRWERVEQDVDDDGNIDRIDHYAFAADGTRSLTRSGFDNDGDGNIDRSEAYSYNSNGNRIRTRFDDDNDARIDRVAFDLDGDGNIDRTAHLNAAGRWERVEQDVDDDGNIDRIDHYAFAADGTRSLTRSESYSYDANGNRTRTAFDTDADGTADRSEAYSYNSNGNRIRTRFDDDNDGRIDRIAFDVDGDGNIDRTAHLNAAGRWERVEQDVDDDGNIDRIDHYAFAADGTRSLTRSGFDNDGDGNIDRSEAYSYNSNGDRIRTRFDDDNDGRVDRVAFDLDGDGNIDRTAHLNAAGRWERVEQDVDDDGNIDRIDHYTFAADGTRSLTRSESYSYDASGNRTRTAFDDDADGTADRSEAYSYDANGNRIRTRFDDDNDGRIDRIAFDVDGDGNIDRTAHLNAAGRWERVEQDVDDDGNIDRIDHYAFDDDGTRSLTRSGFNDDGDGNIDRSEAYSYNSNGNRIRTRFDDDNDGRIDRVAFDVDGDGNIDRTAHLNAAGRWERVEQDVDDDGNIDRIDHYAFAADGTRSLTRRDFDDDDDGNIDRSTASVAENQFLAYEAAATATDADGDPLRYSLSGTDAGLFTIDADTGEVSFRAAPDFEAPGDADRDNVYDIIVTASDGTNRTEQAVAITVTNENDNAPTFTSPATVSVAENQVAAYEAAAADADGDPLSYSLSGTDAALFTINANTGEVSFRAAPDFEAPGDADRDNVYDITVTASDGTNSTNHNVAITVTNENDNVPAFTSPATVSVAENQVATYEAAAAATDADGDPLRYSLSGTDAGLFTIDANTGEVRFRAAPDFEAPGDDDGDNVYDITVTASDGTNSRNHNVAITVTDKYELIPLSTLDGSNGFTLTGIDEDDLSGYSVSSAGDVNGDGYDDLIIGARLAAPNGDNFAGETYVVYGGASAPGTDGVLDLSSLNGTSGFILNGIDAFDRSGISVSSAGDVNGDGYDDLIIGAQGADFSGETYIVYGGASAPGTGGVLDLSTLDGSNGFILNGIDAYDRSGTSVSSAGDVNGDGYDDLIIGAIWADPNGSNFAGETYIVYGGASAPGTDGRFNLSTLNGSNGFTLNGINPFNFSGFSVSSAGDVNGDGYDDLIIGAQGADPNGDSDAGETYIVYGGASAPGTDGVLDLSALNGTNGFTLNGIDAFDLSGFSVSSAGDVNGDGYDDLIIGAFGADPNGDSAAGETYIVYGGASAPGTGGRFNLSALDGSNGFILNGIDANDRSGGSLSSAGDVNGDGYDDLIIGANSAAPNGNLSGETYIVYGGARAPGTGGRLNLSALDGTNGFILNGIDTRDYSGTSVSSAGDVNGDGYDDLIIGAPGADPNGDREAGETYIVYGGATGTESLVPVTASGTAAAAADNFTGNAGADSFTDIATNDVVRGGAGDDTISVTSLDFAAVDGGTGTDQLILDGAGLSLDLTGAGHAGVDSVEVFDLSGTGANTLVLDALAVFDLTEERAGGVASLDVRGGADDRVDLGGSSFALTGTVTEDGTTYNVYRDGNAQLRVEAGVSVTLAATPTGSMGTGTGFGAGANGDGDPERIGDRDASGLSVRLDEDTDGDGDTDRVTYEGDADFAGNFPNNIGLEVVRLDGLDGDGSTDLTIPDEFVFAGNPSGNQVRIEGGKTDTLRFDMDDFAEAPEPVGFGGESYRSFAPDDQTWSFLVDADVMLFDI